MMTNILGFWLGISLVLITFLLYDKYRKKKFVLLETRIEKFMMEYYSFRNVYWIEFRGTKGKVFQVDITKTEYDNLETGQLIKILYEI